MVFLTGAMIVFWLVTFVFVILTMRRTRQLADEVDALQESVEELQPRP
jgi:hypothetical protein